MNDMSPKSIRALVVDDQATMRSIIRQLLAQTGIADVSEAANGRDALALLQSVDVEDPDVIICDLHMEQMDGIQFCNHVRRDEEMRKRQIPILMLTGDKDEMLHEVAAQVGALKVLTKPITAQELKNEIEGAIGFRIDD